MLSEAIKFNLLRINLKWKNGNKSDDDEGSDTGLGLKLDVKEPSVENHNRNSKSVL